MGQTFKKARKFDEPIIEAKDLHFAYVPEREILHGVNLAVHKGEFLIIWRDYKKYCNEMQIGVLPY